MQTVICIKWGTLYGSDYVNRLYRMVKDNTSRPLRFICFTDDATGIEEGVETAPLPDITLPEIMIYRPWRKISLWQNNLYNLEGPVLFLDLDILITGSIDDFFDYKPELSFVVIHNWTTKNKKLAKYNIVGNTTCYRFNVGDHDYLFQQLQEEPIKYFDEYRNSQTYVSNEINDLNYWPEEWCVSFKHSLIPSWPLRYFKKIPYPKHTKLVAFTGKPDIHDVLKGKWPEKKWYKKIYKYYIKPTWIEPIWSDKNR